MKFNGAKLRELRKAAGMGVAAVAKRMGVTASAIHAWERGARNPMQPLVEDVAYVVGAHWLDLCDYDSAEEEAEQRTQHPAGGEFSHLAWKERQKAEAAK